MQAASGFALSCLHYTHECCVPKWLSFIITGQLHNHQNHQNCLNWGIFSIFKSWSIVWACVVLLTLCPTRFDVVTFIIIKKAYDNLLLNGELDFEKALKSTVTASLVVTLLYHPANLVLLQAKHAALLLIMLCDHRITQHY